MPATTPNPEAPPARGRGGNRTGAGAPRGNLNALRNGAHSARVNALYASVPPAVRLHVAVALAWAIATELASPAIEAGHGAPATRAFAHVVACLEAVDWTQAANPVALRQAAVLALAPVFKTSPLPPRPHAKQSKQSNSPATLRPERVIVTAPEATRPAPRAATRRTAVVSELFDPAVWESVPGFTFDDITYHRTHDLKVVRVAFNRPEVRNAFRPGTVDELYTALEDARTTSTVGCVLLTGNGPSPKDGGWAFCSGGDQRVRGKDGYQYEGASGEVDPARLGRLHILEVQRLIRFMPKIVIAVVPGWAVGGGHSLHVTCDLTIASQEHALFKQTDPDVASFDSGYGSALLARQVGQKRAREVFFLGFNYSAQEAFELGMVNKVVPHADLERVALEWARTINGKSPTAMRMLKYGFNLPDDGLLGQQLFAGEATRLAYATEEAQEGRDAFIQKRRPDFERFPWHY